MRWLDSIISSTDMSLSKLQEIVKDRAAWRVVHGVAKSQTEQSNRTTTYKLAGLPSDLWIKRLEDVRRDYPGVAENITSLHSYYTTIITTVKLKSIPQFGCVFQGFNHLPWWLQPLPSSGLNCNSCTKLWSTSTETWGKEADIWVKSQQALKHHCFKQIKKKNIMKILKPTS